LLSLLRYLAGSTGLHIRAIPLIETATRRPILVVLNLLRYLAVSTGLFARAITSIATAPRWPYMVILNSLWPNILKCIKMPSCINISARKGKTVDSISSKVA
jgi:hypothetical protein